MSNRTIIIFSIFFAVAIVGSSFIYLYRDQAELLIADYVAKITVCGNIADEEGCFEKNFCEGIYGPSCPECNDLEFKRCQRVPLKVQAELEQEKGVCQSTGGEWYRSKLGNFCLCQPAGLNKIFDPAKGCINQ